MNEDDQHLQKEVNRLYYIIDLLIKENQRLQSILPDNLKTGMLNNADSINYLRGIVSNNVISSNPLKGFESNDSISSKPEKENILNDFISSNPLKVMQSNEVISSNRLEDSSLNRLVSSNAENGFPSNNLISSNPLEGLPSKQFIQPNQQNENILNEFTAANVENGSALNKPVLSNQQKDNGEKHFNIIAAIKSLRTDKVSASRESVKNSLKLLQHLATNPQNNTRQLSKATGMSESGLSKRLSALRKQGYVTKLKVRHYEVTQKGLDVLNR